MFKIRFHYLIVKLLARFYRTLFDRYFKEYLEAYYFDKKEDK